MKKQIIALSLAGLALVASPALAKDNNSDHGLKLGQVKHLLHFAGKHSSQFAVSGTIKSVGSDNVVITSDKTFNVTAANGEVTVKTNADTKIVTSSDHKTQLALTNLAVGQKVIVMGSLADSVAYAKHIVVINSGKILGKVTAKTDNSITITNGVTAETKTITTDADTKIRIDGETKTVADINVGDSGWVKFKTVGATLVAKIVNLFR